MLLLELWHCRLQRCSCAVFKVLDLPGSVLVGHSLPSDQPSSNYKAAVDLFLQSSNSTDVKEQEGVSLPDVQESQTALLQQLMDSAKTLTAKQDLLNTLRSVCITFFGAVVYSLKHHSCIIFLQTTLTFTDVNFVLKGSICWCTQLGPEATVSSCLETAAPDLLWSCFPVYHWAEVHSWPRIRCVHRSRETWTDHTPSSH